jgi:hypothetical protein
MTTDDRPEPPYLGDETGTLAGFLREQLDGVTGE